MNRMCLATHATVHFTLDDSVHYQTHQKDRMLGFADTGMKVVRFLITHYCVMCTISRQWPDDFE